ncbi:unnamed protein product [Auanema sp. JU1783]|nr:unnamed protein product [Auanema sp. JU1783]
MYLTYVQHVGCSTRMLVMSPASEDLKCPDCQKQIDPFNWTNSPLPCPFVEQVNARCAIVIKPTNGYFQSYKIGDDLHIGISDSHSVIHSFWTNGITAAASSWDKSILVYQFANNENNWFDSSLYNFINEHCPKFLAQMYNDIEWNCFDFVTEYLRYINFRNYTKVHFVAEFIQDTLKNSMKYCTLVNKVMERGSILIG